ncbi:MAG: hypothetical protein UX13_C0026G0013 [Candidatus Woesebacteria bacterium GW2011_GWB1_45_5]|uniref:2TM domain-containing protein n=1 Tax=Candidatus Woesebacteria bacterium GW2011_GWB1_45_5 TaxID=1618581 RepID=A0A0G1MP55_9BACT|nr:MAG: hypothetical protein UX13_C0026G0013 [Candidatus Woesebacteria bacterium GW2011_GWB1_45_5]
MKRYNKYWKDHPYYNAFVHVAGGLALGFLLWGYFEIGNITWGWILGIAWLAGHLWPFLNDK